MAYFQDGSDAMNELEAMIDKVGTANVAYAVARICALKAEHLQSNWSDKATAKVWDKCSTAWDRFAQHCPTSPLDPS
jgi:hypothetical protein